MMKAKGRKLGEACGSHFPCVGLRFFATPSDSVAIIFGNVVNAIPYFSSGLKGVARSLRNAMVVVKVPGGSIDDLLDLIAIARFVGLELTCNDFQKVSETGGTLAVIRYLLDHKYLDGDCMTGMSNLILLHFFVYCNFQALISNILNICCNGFFTLVTGKTLAENAESFPRLPDGQVGGTGDFPPKMLGFIKPMPTPIKKTGDIQTLRGNLAPEDCVPKITGIGLYFPGPAFVFEGVEAAISENPSSFKENLNGDKLVPVED
ncbi:hypothetical protein V6N11_001803 [Hibiscus sabdariffa]|uniref:Dihydroxy-acid/6-phosphogluconate dehydratase C-terminal domain-containing protein n=1 Tax=Hibiscus sabdariffa TaxID=183260 RepID=A0ABR2QTK2_9ROSI